MSTYKCPRCQEKSITIANKYVAGFWLSITCPSCKARLGAYPWFLVGLHMLYLWNVLWFIGLFLERGDPMFFVYLVFGWIVLDIANLQLIPLAVLRQRDP